MTTYKSIKYDFDGSNITGVAIKPTVSSISPSSKTGAELAAGTTIAITGTNFSSGATVNFIHANGTIVASPTVVVNSATSITATVASSMAGTNSDPIDIQVGSSASGTGDNLLSIDDNPVFNTAAGTLGTVTDGVRGAGNYTLSPVTAVDPEGVSVTYTKTAGSYPTGMSLNSSTGALTGALNAVGSNTTYTFTIRATAGSQTSDRQFSIVIAAPTVTEFTTAGAGTHTPVFSGTMAVLAIGAGGGGDSGPAGGHNGGGGGGGLILHPSYSVSSGSAVPFFIGSGTSSGTGENTQWGQNNGTATTTSTILTALGGGSSGGSNGGSGGGRSHSTGTPGQGIQTNSTTTSPNSRTYGFGNNGGTATYQNPSHPSGGGGGAGAVGGNASGGNQAGNGGAGKDVTSTFGSGVTNSGVFAGGGGGGTHQAGHSGAAGSGGGGHGTTTGNSSIGQNGTANTGGGAGADALGGSGIIIIKY